MNAFHVLGGMFAAWALLLAFLGVTRENFPTSKRAERAVILISLTLFVCAVGSAILTAISEHKGEDHKGGERALMLPV